jgi:hypothetical protein
MLGWSLSDRDTVVMETPSSQASSAIEMGDGTPEPEFLRALMTVSDKK